MVDCKIVIYREEKTGTEKVLELSSENGNPHIKIEVIFSSQSESLLGFYRGQVVLYNVPIRLLKYNQNKVNNFIIDVYIATSLTRNYSDWVFLFSATYLRPLSTINNHIMETSFSITLTPTPTFYIEDKKIEVKKGITTINMLILDIFTNMKVNIEGDKLKYSKVINEDLSFNNRVEALKYLIKNGFLFFNNLFKRIELLDLRSPSIDVFIFTEEAYKNMLKSIGEFTFMQKFNIKTLKQYTIPKNIGVYTEFTEYLANSWELACKFPQCLRYEIGDWVQFTEENGKIVFGRIITSNITINTRGMSFKKYLIKGAYEN